MGLIDRCRFDTERLEVLPWHEVHGDDALARVVAGLLSSNVTAALPSDWQGPYDADRAASWITARDGESTVLAGVEHSSTDPIGLLMIAGDEATPGRNLRIGYLLAEEAWGRGFATELVGGLVDWCRSVGTMRSLTGGVESGNAASVRVLERNGFESVGPADVASLTYRLELDGATGATIRPEAPADHDAIRDVVTAAFGSEIEADLVERIRAAPEYLPDLALVADIGGEIVGHVMISGAAVSGEHGRRPIVMLSPLAVAPDHQRRGIGAELVVTAVDGAERRGEPLVALEGNPAYYGRFGFEHSIAHGLSLPLPAWAPSEAGQLVLLAAFDPDDPSLRGEVVYPVAFDGLED